MTTRILIVEDEAITALDLKSELISSGHEVIGVTSDGIEAVRAAAELKPDIVLMDIHLSGEIDGIAAASAIRGEANIPVIFLTAHVDDTILERAMKASPFGYIPKPFQMPAIEAAIKVALYRHGKEQESRDLVETLQE